MVIKKLDLLEWIGTILAMVASALVATNTVPAVGYVLYLLSALTIGYVVHKLKRKALFFLQGYFVLINLIGIYTYF